MIKVHVNDECPYQIKVIPQKPYTIEVNDITVVRGEAYEGPYEVTPTADGFDLETGDKWMTDDLTIKPIPYYETSNISGITVYIAGSVEF